MPWLQHRPSWPNRRTRDAVYLAGIPVLLIAALVDHLRPTRHPRWSAAYWIVASKD
jgi:hypothetical protein